jgi:hypothetical protein
MEAKVILVLSIVCILSISGTLAISSTNNSPVPEGALWIESGNLHWGNGSTEFWITDEGHNLYLESSTCDDPGYCGSLIEIDGDQIFSGRGINVLNYAENGSLMSYGSYDVHSNDRYRYTENVSEGKPNLPDYTSCTGCANEVLYNDLQNIPAENTVIIVGDDQPDPDHNKHDDNRPFGQDIEDIAANKFLGEMGGNQELSYRDMWILIYKNGNRVKEKYADRGSNSGIAKVNATYTISGTGKSTKGPVGALWIEGKSIHWIDDNQEENSYRGTLVGQSSGPKGALWIENSMLHYIDAEGHERKTIR